jgi:2-desacetyl-2-hydroxyethyl bacteriochlorophyllide A dehydrogenase
MLAARFKEAGKPFVVEQVEIPSIGSSDVLIAIRAAGVCGTDVHYHSGEFAPYYIPLTLGHEGAGIVTAVGENVTHLQVGDSVIVHYIVSCGNCEPCLQGFDNRCRNRKSIGSHIDGTFAEYIKVPARSALKMSDTIPYDWGAIAACAVSTAYHAVDISGLQRGGTVVVFGVGGVGLHAVLWSKFFGGRTVIAVDPIDSKLNIAKEYGADVLLNPTRDNIQAEVNGITDSWGVDVAIECSGSPVAMKQAIDAIKGKNRYESGSVVSVGLQITPIQVEYWGLREGRLMVSGDHTRYDLQRIIKLMETKKIDLDKSITHHIPIHAVNDGIKLIENGQEHVERVVVDFNLT